MNFSCIEKSELGIYTYCYVFKIYSSVSCHLSTSIYTMSCISDRVYVSIAKTNEITENDC